VGSSLERKGDKNGEEIYLEKNSLVEPRTLLRIGAYWENEMIIND